MGKNRLQSAKSPYLRQHANNPVNWQPWDDLAFATAVQEDKPIFLSIGYSSCHWCHVMEHESFENSDVARLLNDYFVSIKVDREERPDVDEAYMTAVQLATGRGGWPMTIFMTPDRKPFFVGTYFPLEDRGEYPGFFTIVASVAKSWEENRAELVKRADAFALAIEESLASEIPTSDSSPDENVVELAVSQFLSRFDWGHGGMVGSPKFPPHQMLSLLLYLAKNRDREDCLKAATRTLECMMLGGIHDHVGGGFHRYSTDDIWLLPHFEKMLYDNGLLLGSYWEAARLIDSYEFDRTAYRIVGWLQREMLAEDGSFFSALDADSQGEEGLFYTWKWDELVDILGSDDHPFLEVYQVRAEGNYEDEATRFPSGRNILHLLEPQHDQYDHELKLLLQARSCRTRPALDDKCLTAWNGYVISSLSKAGFVDLASDAAKVFLRESELPHMIVNGEYDGLAFLDAVALVEALIDLSEASGSSKWRDEAVRRFEWFTNNFHNDEVGWVFSSNRHERLFGYSRPVVDSATPSAVGQAIRCAVRLGETEMAARDLEKHKVWMVRAPLATVTLIHAYALLEGQVSKRVANAGLIFEKPVLVVEDVRKTESSSPAGSQVVFIDILMKTKPRYQLKNLMPKIEGLENPGYQISHKPSSGDRICFTVYGEINQDLDEEATIQIDYELCTESECWPRQSVEIKVPIPRE